jgi:hypothetical protein
MLAGRQECQVDYGTGPMVRDPVTGKYRRTRLFVLTLGCLIPAPACCCANTWNRNAVGIASATRTNRGARHCTHKAGASIGAVCDAIHDRQGEAGLRRIMGVLALVKKYGCPATENACAAALELCVAEYRFVRRYLERSPQAPLTLRQVDPLIRELTQYRDLIQQRINFEETNHEPDRT